jgi:fatty acid desaturase
LTFLRSNRSAEYLRVKKCVLEKLRNDVTMSRGCQISLVISSFKLQAKKAKTNKNHVTNRIVFTPRSLTAQNSQPLMNSPGTTSTSAALAPATTATATTTATAATATAAAATATREDLWTIHGRHYDLRMFMAEGLHPGGAEAISLGQGLDDCTTLFESYHPFTDKPAKILAKFLYTGKILPSDACHADSAHMREVTDKALAAHEGLRLQQAGKADLNDDGSSSSSSNGAYLQDPFFDWDKTPFFDECKQAAKAHFSPKGSESSSEIHANMKATPLAWLQHGVGVALCCWMFAQFVAGSVPALTLFPLAYWIVGSDLGHNGSHFAMSTVPWVNTAAAYFGSLWVQNHLWKVQHVIGHHVHTNILHMDPDVHHFAFDNTVTEALIPGYRTHPQQEVLSKYGWGWRFAMLFQIWATTFAISLANVPKYLEERAMGVTKIRTAWLQPIRNDRLLVLAGCLMFMRHHGALYGFWSIFWSWGIHGVLFHIFSQISHTNEDSMVGSDQYKAKHNLRKVEWAIHEMLTARDYSCDSWFWSTLSINLNNQTMHHLFPSVHPCHYPALRREVIPIAQRHGIDYEARSTDDFFGAVSKYFGWVRKLNEIESEGGGGMMMTESKEASSESPRWLVQLGTLVVCAVLAVPTYCTFLAPLLCSSSLAAEAGGEGAQQEGAPLLQLVALALLLLAPTTLLLQSGKHKHRLTSVSESTRVLMQAGTLIVGAVIAIPAATFLVPEHEWAPAGAFAAILVPLLTLVRSEHMAHQQTN